MMVVFFGLFVILCLVGIKFKPSDGQKYMTDSMSVDKTMSIKGIFIILVFFSHFNSYVTYTASLDVAYFNVFKQIGQCMVTLFLFYSGYGVMESIKKKGSGYVHKMPLTRVAGTLFRFDIAILLFLIVSLAFGSEFSLKRLLLSFIGWDSFGNSNWYIFAMLIAYIVTFIAFEISGKFGSDSHFIGALITTVGCCGYIFVLSHFKLKDSYWYDTIICYACGIWYSLLREKIEKIINKNIAVWLVFFVASAAGTVYFAMNRPKGFIHTECCMLLFTAMVVLFTMRVSVHNKILCWCGKNLFGLYILQRIPMIVFKEIGVAGFNLYVYFILCLVVTVPMAWAFEKYIGKLWKIITTSRKKTT